MWKQIRAQENKDPKHGKIKYLFHGDVVVVFQRGLFGSQAHVQLVLGLKAGRNRVTLTQVGFISELRIRICNVQIQHYTYFE